MWYIVIVMVSMMLGVIIASRMEYYLLKKGASREVVEMLAITTSFSVFVLGLLSPMVFDYQLRTNGETLYVENADGNISKPLIGRFHKPFTSEVERRSFRFNPEPHSNAERGVFLVSFDTNSDEVRTLSFRMTRQYTISPEEYRQLQKAGEINYALINKLDSQLTLQAFQLMRRKPETVRDLLFSVKGSQGRSFDQEVCQAIPQFMREHLESPVPWIEVGEPFSCFLTILK